MNPIWSCSLLQKNCPEVTQSPPPSFIRVLTTAVIQGTVTGTSVYRYHCCHGNKTYTNSIVTVTMLICLVLSVMIRSFTFCPGSGTSAVFEDKRFKKRLMVLKKYVDESQDLQMEILYALQITVAKLEHPPSKRNHTYACTHIRTHTKLTCTHTHTSSITCI